jgi:vacuolar protein sorting-associated protein 72
LESIRITKLLEDEAEQDEVFWNQDALKDVGVAPSLPPSFAFSLLGFFFSFPLFLLPSQEEDDDNYEEEQDAGDEFDSDFGEDVRYLPSRI